MISVIIPTFNRGYLISQTIDSILCQSITEIELIVVDDHSNDGTQEIVEAYIKKDSRVIFAKRPSNYPKGANSCRNYGFVLSKGEFIKWIDSDDLLTINALELQLSSLEFSEADLSICHTEVFYNNPSDLVQRWGNITTEPSVSNFLQANFRWHTGAGLWRKSYFRSIPPWKEGLMNSQEWLMHLTQLVQGVILVKVPQMLCLVRAHRGSMSHKSNKSSGYYFNELKARKFAFDLLYVNKVNLSPLALKKIRQQFLLYHIFILYKLGFIKFIRGFGFYAAMLRLRK